MRRIFVISTFLAMLALAVQGSPNRARAADPDAADTAVQTAPEPPTRNYFEQLERDQAAADSAACCQ